MTAKVTKYTDDGKIAFQLEYRLHDSFWWYTSPGSNDTVFVLLGINKLEHCRRFYKAICGDWPSTPSGMRKQRRQQVLIQAMRALEEYGCHVEMVDENGNSVYGDGTPLKLEKFFKL